MAVEKLKSEQYTFDDLVLSLGDTSDSFKSELTDLLLSNGLSKEQINLEQFREIVEQYLLDVFLTLGSKKINEDHQP